MSIAADPLRARGSDVAALGDTLRRGGAALESVPAQIKQLLRTEEWRHFVTKLGKEVRHERFADFVTTPPLVGLGATVALIKRLVKGDPEAEDLLDQALQSPSSIHAVNNIDGTERPKGTSKAYALRKLRKDAPELHAEVLAGRLTAHKAMVQAGFRPPTFTLRADSAESVAAALRRQLDPETLSKVAQLINEEG